MHHRYRPTISVSDQSQKSLELHAKTGDYFDYLATVIGLLVETTPKDHGAAHNISNGMKELRENLRYMNQCYRIVPKDCAHCEPKSS